MNIKWFLCLIVVVLFALSVLCVFCPVISYAYTPSDEFDFYSEPFVGASLPNASGVNDLVELTQKAYQIGLFGGNVPIISTVNNRTLNVEIICVSIWSGDSGSPYNDISSIEFTDFELSGVYMSSNNMAELIMYSLSENGTYNPIDVGYTGYYLGYNNVYVILDIETGLYRQVSYYDYDDASMPSSSTVDFGLGQILGAYDRILEGYTVGGDGYDDGYNAGYLDGLASGREYGYNDGYSVGHDIGYQEGYETGYDNGYETGYDDGWETGYYIGFDHGTDYGRGVGYNEGYDDGYETGYWDGWDEGYDDGYDVGIEDGSPIELDIPSVITAVPQSAKSIINNAFGFELFGINVAGLLSVLLIVAIIGFVVKWLMSR